MKQVFISLFGLILLAYSTAPGQILNADFENWTGSTPDDWQANNAGGLAPISQSLASHSGSYAVKGKVVAQSSGFPYPPSLISGAAAEGFLINTRPGALRGFYMFSPATSYPYGDTLTIAVSVSKQDTVIGTGAYVTGKTTDTGYAAFAVNIYYMANGTPDLINISVNIGPFGIPGSFFLLDDLSLGPAVAVEEFRSDVPSGYGLSQNYPNPFNPSTKIEFTLPHSGFTTLRILNVLGEEVGKLIECDIPAGSHTVQWTAGNVSSGTYYYQLRSGDFMQTRKLVLSK